MTFCRKIEFQAHFKMQYEYVIHLSYDKFVCQYHVYLQSNIAQKYELYLDLHETTHNLYGPAEILYRYNGKILQSIYFIMDFKHNECNPAVITYDSAGTMFEIQHHHNGLLHNDHGPAVIRYPFAPSGSIRREYWKNNKRIS